jgi:hypothetical protein
MGGWEGGREEKRHTKEEKRGGDASPDIEMENIS